MNIAVVDDISAERESIRRILADYAAATLRGGSGIGLESISSAAERYGGTASFRHDGGEFISGIVIPMVND